MAKSYAWLAPAYVPTGFKFFGAVEGLSAGEFWDSEGQIALRYHQRPSDNPPLLTVAWAPERDRVLTGTDQRAGRVIDVKGVEAIYHNGSWAPGPGSDQVDTPVGPLHWDGHLVHSLTAHTDRGVFAVSCRRIDIPDVVELTRVMSSIPRV